MAVKFYNDSKSTIPQATLAAIEKLKSINILNPIMVTPEKCETFYRGDIILFLGGISKGVDRSILVTELKNKVKHILCFGGEAEQLYEFCKQNLIAASYHKNLESAFSKALEVSSANDILLFSPAGASFDLFKDYKDRGNKFKELVNQYKFK